MIPTDPLIIIQGIETARYWLSRPDCRELSFLCYDARSFHLLETAKYPVLQEDKYLNLSNNDLTHLEAAASKISIGMHQVMRDRVGDAHFQPEEAVIRSINYCLLSIVRAIGILNGIAKAGHQRIWVNRSDIDTKSYSGIRWKAWESPVPLLLERDTGEWGFRTEYFPACQNVPPQHLKRNSEVLSSLFQKFLNRSKHSDVLFSGNSSLLGPIADVLVRDHGRASTFFQWGSGFVNTLGKQIKYGHAVGVPGPQKVLFPEENDVYNRLDKSGLFRIDRYDLLPVAWPKLRQFYIWEKKSLCVLEGRILRILQQIKPSYIVLDEDVTDRQRCLALAARKLNIPTAVMMHGLPGNPIGFMPTVGRKYFAWGDYSKNILTEWGMDPDIITVTGCPKYDALYKTIHNHESREVPGSSVDARPMLLILPGGLRSNLEQFAFRNNTPLKIRNALFHFIQAASEYPGLDFTVKFRMAGWTRDMLESWKSSISNFPSNMKWVYTGSAIEYIRKSTVIFNDCSSAALEAAVLRKPVVTMNFSDHPDQFNFSENGCVQTVRSYEDLSRLCAEIRNGSVDFERWISRQQPLIKNYLCFDDGNSANRVAESLEKSLKQNSGIKAVR